MRRSPSLLKTLANVRVIRKTRKACFLHFLKRIKIMQTVIALFAILLLYVYVVSRADTHRFVIKEYTFSSSKIKEPKTIVFLSDLHENEYEIKNSFPDIIIKYKTHQLIIEVKQDNDDHSNNGKINNLLKAYEKYIAEKKEKLISDDLTLSIALISPSPNEKVRFKGYSTKQEINEYLNNHKESSFHTFFKKIQNCTK